MNSPNPVRLFDKVGLLTKYCKSQCHMVQFNRVMLNDDQKS